MIPVKKLKHGVGIIMNSDARGVSSLSSKELHKESISRDFLKVVVQFFFGGATPQEVMCQQTNSLLNSGTDMEKIKAQLID